MTVTWDDYAASRRNRHWASLGTGSSTVYFGGDSWTVRNLTFENAAGPVGQAVAVVPRDRPAFHRLPLLGNQIRSTSAAGNRDGQTVTENAHIRFDDCYVEERPTSFFGSAAALFRRCEIRSKADSYVTAASTCRGSRAG